MVISTGIWFSGRKSRGVNNFFQQPDLRLRLDSTVRVSRLENTNPHPEADFSISPSGYNYEIQSSVFCVGYLVPAFVRKICFHNYLYKCKSATTSISPIGTGLMIGLSIEMTNERNAGHRQEKTQQKIVSSGMLRISFL